MVTIVSITFSAPALSFLLYDNTKCTSQQEGFLLGEIVHKEVSVITDSDRRQLNILKTIKINAAVPCPQPRYFYTGDGKVDKTKVQTLLRNNMCNVVGWYKYHQNFDTLRLNFRTTLIHKQLQELFGVNPEYFTCCVLIAEKSTNKAHHTFTQYFVRYHRGRYDNIPFTIPNLSNPNDAYRSGEQPSETFSRIMENLEIERVNDNALEAITKIQDALQNHTEMLLKKLSLKEVELFKLEEEIQQLEYVNKMKSSGATTTTTSGSSKDDARPSTSKQESPDRETPSTSKRDAPSTSKRDAPSTSKRDAPSTSKRDAPSTSKRDAPSTSKQETPSTSKREAPSTSKREAPTKVEQPSSSQLITEKMPSISKEKVERPSTRKREISEEEETPSSNKREASTSKTKIPKHEETSSTSKGEVSGKVERHSTRKREISEEEETSHISKPEVSRKLTGPSTSKQEPSEEEEISKPKISRKMEKPSTSKQKTPIRKRSITEEPQSPKTRKVTGREELEIDQPHQEMEEAEALDLSLSSDSKYRDDEESRSSSVETSPEEGVKSVPSKSKRRKRGKRNKKKK